MLVCLLSLSILLAHAFGADKIQCVRHATKSHSNYHFCADNDTYCGDWKEKEWIPSYKCQYRDPTTEDAQKCLANRTLACIGDSQLRGLCISLAYVLYGISLEDVGEKAYNHLGEEPYKFADPVPSFATIWAKKHNTSGVSLLFPKREIMTENNLNWQVQIWMYYTVESAKDNIRDVLSNKAATETPENRTNLAFNPIDFAFMNLGAHEPWLFNSTPHGDLYYKNVVEPVWIDIVRDKSITVPFVYVSLNHQCKVKLHPSYHFQVSSIIAILYNSVLYLHEVCLFCCVCIMSLLSQ